MRTGRAATFAVVTLLLLTDQTDVLASALAAVWLAIIALAIGLLAARLLLRPPVQ